MTSLLLSAETMMAEARSQTGLDLSDEQVAEPLTILLHSLNYESRLHPAGQKGMHDKLVRILGVRLRMQRDFAAHPEIHDEVIQAPIFICGMGRTGSTKTQKLLAASGDFNWLPYWQVIQSALISGDRAESPQSRIDETEAFVRWFDAASPETKYGHAFATDEPEEESFILEQSLISPVLMGWAPLPSYLGWLMTQDMSAQFLHLRDTLKYLQWQGLARRDRPWLLKSPLYSGMEPLLLQTFPDARLLMTHRSPLETMPSGLRLLECFHKPFTNAAPDPVAFVAGQAFAINAHLDLRPTLDLLDLDFREVVGRPAPLAARIWNWLGMPLEPQSLANMELWDADNPPNKAGRHIYALGDYGLTREGLAVSFDRYLEFLEANFNGRV